MEGRGRNPQRQRTAGHRRRLTSALTGALFGTLAVGLAACGDPARDLEVGTIGYAEGFAGVAAAEEPRAVLVARDVLSAGGTAADAAAAMALTLTVTLPTSAGLGGGGLCLIHDEPTKTTEVLDFLPPASPGPVAVPALPRGLFALHAKYGRLRWQSLVSPAENLARFGERVSRALAAEMDAVPPGRLAGDVAAARVLTTAEGRRLQQGAMLMQHDLAGVLGQMRERGVGVLYTGLLGRDWLEGAQRLGSPLTMDALRAYQPRFVQTTRFEEGNETIHATQGWPGDAVAAAYRGEAAGLAPRLSGPGATGFVVADMGGSAVACTLTMNGAFGTGRMLPGLGLFAAVPAPEAGQSSLPLALVMQINHNVNEFRFAATAEGPGAAANVARSAKAVVQEQQPLQQALTAIAAAPAGPAVVTAVACPAGLPPRPDSCSVARDPRSNGYGAVVGLE